MKNLIILLVTVFILIIGSIFFIKFNPFTNEVNTLNLYTKADKLKKNDLFSNNNGTEIYYFYQEDCSNCNAIKGDIVNLYNKLINTDNTNLYLIDMGDKNNSSLWYDWNKHYQDFPGSQNPFDNPNYKGTEEDINNISDLAIVGTPTMIVRQNGKTVQYRVGSDEVLDLLNYATGEKATEEHKD